MIESLIGISPTIGTILFFGFFCCVVYSVFKKGAKKKLDEYSNIPLNDEKTVKENDK
ncbi:MAG: cbb3-type cytochrome c oxidase subunit 3 [Rickettsiales bacterium]|nr:cbb3-type cytochrome c oxidase subunit 3 [Rickettsiales bacterium]